MKTFVYYEDWCGGLGPPGRQLVPGNSVTWCNSTMYYYTINRLVLWFCYFTEIELFTEDSASLKIRQEFSVITSVD